jgi:cell division protein FtsI (penicillin-binding protein 3)
VPSRQPALTILVVIDTPRGGHHYGGDVAAPVFKRIADTALSHIGVPATIRPIPPIVVTASAERALPPSQPNLVQVNTVVGEPKVMPDVRGLAARDAVRALGTLGLSVRLRGTGFVTAQTPQPGQTVESGEVGVLDLKRSKADASATPGGRER